MKEKEISTRLLELEARVQLLEEWIEAFEAKVRIEDDVVTAVQKRRQQLRRITTGIIGNMEGK